jgi:hypothetical protein
MREDYTHAAILESTISQGYGHISNTLRTLN